MNGCIRSTGKQRTVPGKRSKQFPMERQHHLRIGQQRKAQLTIMQCVPVQKHLQAKLYTAAIQQKQRNDKYTE